MAYEGQKARSEARMAMREAGTQDTQRSWSNYVGDKPIKRMMYQPAFGSEALSYTSSPLYNPNAQSQLPPPPTAPSTPQPQSYSSFGYTSPFSSIYGPSLGYGAGGASPMIASPVVLSNAPASEQFGYLTGATRFGGLPMFPFSNY